MGASAAEPRGRLGRPPDTPDEGASETSERASSGPGGHHGQGEPAPQGRHDDPGEQAGPPDKDDQGRPHDDRPSDDDEDPPGSSRSFLLGLAWWP